MTITDTSTLRELRDELERIGIRQVSARINIATSTVSVTGLAMYQPGGMNAFEATAGTIGGAIDALCSGVEKVRKQLVIESINHGITCGKCGKPPDMAMLDGYRTYCVACSYLVAP